MEEERLNHENKIRKMEKEMEMVFQTKVKEKTQKIHESEQQVRR